MISLGVIVAFGVTVNILRAAGCVELASSNQSQSDAVGQDQQTGIEYIVSDAMQPYVRDEKECMGYRVVVPADASQEQLLDVFDKVTSNDGYYLHTAWFFSDSSLADGGATYDVAMIEEDGEGADPIVNMA